MTIHIDARMVNFSGIGRYLKDLLSEFGKMRDIPRIELSGKKEELLPYCGDNIHFACEKSEKIYSPFEFFCRTTSDCTLLHVPHYNTPFLINRPMLVTIHDLNHLLFPELLNNRAKLKYAELRLKIAVKKSSKIIAISESTKRDLINHLGVNEGKIKVIYNGISDKFLKEFTFEELDLFKLKYCLPANYLLTIGIFKCHKNFKRIALVHKKLFNSSKLNHKLVFAGMGKQDQLIFKKWLFENGCENSSIIMDYLPDEDLIKLYKGSTLVIAGSLHEGFGYLAGEALKAKIPLIASNRSSIPEVAGPGALYFDPESGSEMEGALLKVVDNKELQKKLSLDGFNHISKFTTQSFASQVMDLYKEFL